MADFLPDRVYTYGYFTNQVGLIPSKIKMLSDL